MRVQILNALTLDGPSTATLLADRLGVRSGSTSWHLQKLAEHGFIAEIPDRGTTRERWWQVVTPEWSVDAGAFLSADSELADATAALLSSVMAQHLAGATQFLNTEWPRPWREAFILSTEHSLRLSPEQMLKMRADLVKVLERYRKRQTDTADAEWVQFQMQGFPYRKSPGQPE